MRLRILDFDIENRPLTYIGNDFTTSDVTAIAARFVDRRRMYCWLLGRHSYRAMLGGFRELYDQADIVVGHYIREHDLPILNGAMIEFGLPALGPKLTCDTKLDYVRAKGVSESQENMSEEFGVDAPKVHMSGHGWRIANRLEAKGIRLAKARVTGDVNQNILLREALLKRDLLGPPQVWRPR